VENGAKMKRLDRDVRKENGGCFSSDRVGGAGMLQFLYCSTPKKGNWSIITGNPWGSPWSSP